MSSSKRFDVTKLQQMKLKFVGVLLLNRKEVDVYQKKTRNEFVSTKFTGFFFVIKLSLQIFVLVSIY